MKNIIVTYIVKNTSQAITKRYDAKGCVTTVVHVGEPMTAKELDNDNQCAIVASSLINEGKQYAI